MWDFLLNAINTIYEFEIYLIGGIINGIFMIINNVSEASLASIVGFLIAVLVPLAFFLIKSDDNNQISDFDRLVIFEDVINIYSFPISFVLIFLVLFFWPNYDSQTFSINIVTIKFVLLLLYFLSLYYLSSIFYRSYCWMADVGNVNESKRNEYRKEQLDKMSNPSGFSKNSKKNLYDSWGKLFDQFKNIKEKRKQGITVSFVSSDIIIDKFLNLLSSDIDQNISGELINLLIDNLDSFIDFSSINKISDFYISSLELSKDKDKNGKETFKYSLPENLYNFQRLYRDFLKKIFEFHDGETYSNLVITKFHNKILKKFKKSKDKENAFIFADSLLKRNASTILEYFPDSFTNEFPTEWRFSYSTIKYQSNNKNDLSDLNNYIQNEWFSYYLIYLFGPGYNKHLAFIPNSSNSKWNPFTNTEQNVATTILLSADPIIWARLCMLWLYVICFSTEEETSEALIYQLIQSETKFGHVSRPLFSSDSSDDENSNKHNSEIDESYNIALYCLKGFKNIEKLKAVRKIIQSHDTYTHFKDNKLAKSNIDSYIKVIDHILEILNREKNN